MTDELRERARQFNSAKLRQDLYTALDQWHRGGTGPQLEAVLPIITAIRDEAAALALEEAAQVACQWCRERFQMLPDGIHHDRTSVCAEGSSECLIRPFCLGQPIRSLRLNLAAVRERIEGETVDERDAAWTVALRRNPISGFIRPDQAEEVLQRITAQARLEEAQDIQRTSCLAWDDTMDRFLAERLAQLEAEAGGGKCHS